MQSKPGEKLENETTTTKPKSPTLSNQGTETAGLKKATGRNLGAVA